MGVCGGCGGRQTRDEGMTLIEGLNFVSSNRSPRNFNIPLVTMTNVLRNTKEVSAALDSARNEQVKELSVDVVIMKLKDFLSVDVVLLKQYSV